MTDRSVPEKLSPFYAFVHPEILTKEPLWQASKCLSVLSTCCAPQCFTEQASEISTAAWNLPFQPAPVAAPVSSAFRQTQSILLCVLVPRRTPPSPEISSPGLAIKCQEEPPKCIPRFPQHPPCGVLFLLHLVEWNG